MRILYQFSGVLEKLQLLYVGNVLLRGHVLEEFSQVVDFKETSWRKNSHGFFGLCEVLCIKNYFIELSRFAREGITSVKLKVVGSLRSGVQNFSLSDYSTTIVGCRSGFEGAVLNH